MLDSQALLAAAHDLQPSMVKWRRSMHRGPELGLDNPNAQRMIVDALEPLGYEITTGSALTSVTATLRGAKPGPTVLLRADTDALPMTEDLAVAADGTPLDTAVRSEIDGVAHTCGHDAHVAMLLGAAHLLAERVDDLTGTVRLVFQPGEEGQGGAAIMIAEGALTEGLERPVDAAFAIHVTPNAPVGFAATRPGALLAATDELRVVVTGRGGHASMPHLGNDPLPAACEMVGALATYIGRRIDAFDPAVMTIGYMRSGTTTNVIPERSEFGGTIRTVSARTREQMASGVKRVIEGVADAHDCQREVTLTTGYPVTENNPAFVAFASDVAESVLGQDRVISLASPVMGAEDFSYFLQRVPGAMVFLGVCPADITNSLEAPPNHSNRMRLNEDALPTGAAFHAAIALNYASSTVAPTI